MHVATYADIMIMICIEAVSVHVFSYRTGELLQFAKFILLTFTISNPVAIGHSFVIDCLSKNHASHGQFTPPILPG